MTGMGVVRGAPPLVEVKLDGVLRLTLNRPEKRNALSWELLEALDDALARCAGDPSVRCVAIAGAGDRAFSAGADLRDALSLTPESARRWIALGHQALNRIVDLPQPVIAAVQGFALGGGLELALACDFRILADDAKLGLPEVTRGWTPGWGGVRRAERLLGPARARQLALLGQPIDAPTALAWGLATRVAPALALQETTDAAAQHLAGLAPPAVATLKATLASGLRVDPDDVAADEEALAAFVAGPRFREAIDAFLSKR